MYLIQNTGDHSRPSSTAALATPNPQGSDEDVDDPPASPADSPDAPANGTNDVNVENKTMSKQELDLMFSSVFNM